MCQLSAAAGLVPAGATGTRSAGCQTCVLNQHSPADIMAGIRWRPNKSRGRLQQCHEVLTSPMSNLGSHSATIPFSPDET